MSDQHIITINDDSEPTPSPSFNRTILPNSKTQTHSSNLTVPSFEPLLRIPSGFTTPGTIHLAPSITSTSGKADILTMGNDNEATSDNKANNYIFLPTNRGGGQMLTVKPGSQNFKAKNYVHVVSEVPKAK